MYSGDGRGGRRHKYRASGDPEKRYVLKFRASPHCGTDQRLSAGFDAKAEAKISHLLVMGCDQTRTTLISMGE
jgi:hypothetical protein